ncbi:hypothetical protein [Sphingobium yanoikuyae]|uniref:Uncharacterized protein n=1 Tax=Sphingobium yanoikuyae TaxID=13690 RepID=A0A291MY30_SPHYA|nr:hypothetical protein [Sphingobium yanoikuyae]ATI79901.1 hypothetical protein A6768_07625 [Sphingobium yanoikuyae]
MDKVEDLIAEMEAVFLAPFVDEDRAAKIVADLYQYLSANDLDLTTAQNERLDNLQSEFRSGAGLFKSDLH